MLQTEAVIAELLGALFATYSVLRRARSSEGVGVIVIIWALVLFVAIPLTASAVS